MEQKLDVCLINFRSHINLRMHYLFMVNFVFDSGFEMFVAYAMFMVESTPHHLIVFLTQQHLKFSCLPYLVSFVKPPFVGYWRLAVHLNNGFEKGQLVLDNKV